MSDMVTDDVGAEMSEMDAAAAFEAGAEAAAETATGTDAPPEAAADPGADAGAPSSPEAEPAAAAWAPNEDEFRQLQEQHNALLHYVASNAETPSAHAADEGVAPEIPNMLDPDYETRMAEYLDYRDSQRDRVWEARLEGITPVVQSVQQERAAAQKETIIDAIDVAGFEKDKPEFRQGAEFFAVGMIDQVKAELGLPADQPSARAAEIALRRGAEQFTAFATGQRKAGEEAYIAHMNSLKNAGDQTVPGVTGSGIEGMEDAEDEMDVVRRLSARDR